MMMMVTMRIVVTVVVHHDVQKVNRSTNFVAM